jgi:FAD/FMN-containing dehydrogenase
MNPKPDGLISISSSWDGRALSRPWASRGEKPTSTFEQWVKHCLGVRRYGNNARRLRDLKRQFDPDNVFSSAIPLPD